MLPMLMKPTLITNVLTAQCMKLRQHSIQIYKRVGRWWEKLRIKLCQITLVHVKNHTYHIH